MDYRILDMSTYPRLEHYKHFSSMLDPTVGITAKIDVTNLVRFSKVKKCSFYLAMVHVAALAANRIPEFRQRGKNGGIIEYKECGTSHIELLPSGIYCYCTLWHNMDWNEYIQYSDERRRKAVSSPKIEEDDSSDALYFVSSLPWIHYEQASMPVSSPAVDNPKFCWGKFEEDFKGRLMMPFTVNSNHALMDGMHIGMLYNNLNEEISKITK